jgi:hypothetical protein
MSDDGGAGTATGGEDRADEVATDGGEATEDALAALTDIDHGGELTASDDEVREAVEQAAEDLGESVADVAEAVAHILTSGTGASTNEGVGGAAVGDNSDAASDPRLEALELYRLRREL